jgi:hypothetical protein
MAPSVLDTRSGSEEKVTCSLGIWNRQPITMLVFMAIAAAMRMSSSLA